MTLEIIKYNHNIVKKWAGKTDNNLLKNYLFHITVEEKEIEKILDGKLKYVILKSNIIYIYRPKSFYY